MRKVPFIDSTGLNNCENLCRNSRKEKIQINLSGVKDNIRESLYLSEVPQIVGDENICIAHPLAVKRAWEIDAGLQKDINTNSIDTKRPLLLTDWLPTTKKEMELRGWDELDVVLFSGDAYVDHPSFGTAVIGRLLESEGLKVAIVPQPNWRDDLRDFKKMGIPRCFFAVTAGVMDSMINHYTAGKRLRSNDAYTPEGRPDMRPDRAATIYSRILKELYPDVPLLIGGIEASLRRVTHYDYWDDTLHKTIL